MATALIARLVAIFLGSLRLGPLLTFAPPFSLVRMPTPARMVIAVGLAAAMPLSPVVERLLLTRQGILNAAVHEVVMGLMLMLGLQFAFAAIGVAGRALDIQIGFGLASVIDPTTKAQMPLIESFLTYAAAAVFMGTSAPGDLYAVLTDSFTRFPIGGALPVLAPGGMVDFLGTVSVLALGLVGLVLVVLFLIDATVALISRTLPQMNVLVLGFQVKALAALALLPAMIGLSGAGILRILRLAIDATATMN